jgi:hypothetical protein
LWRGIATACLGTSSASGVLSIWLTPAFAVAIAVAVVDIGVGVVVCVVVVVVVVDIMVFFLSPMALSVVSVLPSL